MTMIITLLFLTGAVAAWVIWGRPWLRTQPWAVQFFAWIEPIELTLWKKSESILWARFLQALGVVTTVLGFFGEIDWTLITPFVPERYQPALPLIPLIISVVGRIEESLRNRTTKPVEMVAVPDDAPPEVAIPIAHADSAKEAAVAAIVEAKAEGSV